MLRDDARCSRAAGPLDPARLMQEMLSAQAQLSTEQQHREVERRNLEKRLDTEQMVKEREVARLNSHVAFLEQQLARSERLRQAAEAELERMHRRQRGD